MKRLLWIQATILIFAGACGTFQLKENAELVIYRSVGRHVGDALVDADREAALKAKGLAESLLKNPSGDISDQLGVLVEQYVEDPLLKMDVLDFLSLIEIQAGEIPDSYYAALQGFIVGIEYGGQE